MVQLEQWFLDWKCILQLDVNKSTVYITRQIHPSKLTTRCVSWRWTRHLKTLRSSRSWMQRGWRSDLGSRITWKAVWRFRCCRSDYLSTEGLSVLSHISLHLCVWVYVWVCLCLIGFVEAARGSSSGQPATGEHVLDSIEDRTVPFHSHSRHPEETWSSTYLAGCLQRPQPHHHHPRRSHWGSLPSCFLFRSDITAFHWQKY